MRRILPFIADIMISTRVWTKSFERHVRPVSLLTSRVVTAVPVVVKTAFKLVPLPRTAAVRIGPAHGLLQRAKG